MPSGSEQITPESPTSPTKMTTAVTTTNGTNGIRERKLSTDGQNNKGPSAKRVSVTSYDPTDYVQRARTTRAAPPKPATNPMQFVKIKPCNLYQSAQEQLKRAEEVKKVKEVKKEDAEDWQCNLDNWKSSRRKRVEHIIDRVVEVKKLELEEHDRTRRKSKTFSEMLEERGTRRKMPLPVYNEDDANDLSDLGIGTSSASGKSSLSEDFDNHSVISDNQDTEKSHSDVDNNSNHENGNNRDYVSSPGYDTSSSTAPASSPDPCEYTYEGAIEGYKLRISRAQSIGFNGFNNGRFSKDSTPERASSLDSGRSSGHENGATAFVPKRPSVTKIEERLINFELKSSSDSSTEPSGVVKKDLPKVDILKRRELFEKDKPAAVTIAPMESTVQKRLSGDFSNAKTIRERLSSFESTQKDETMTNKKTNRLSGDLSSIKARLSNLEKEKKSAEKPSKVDVPVVSLKDRLTSLHSAVTATATVVSGKQEEERLAAENANNNQVSVTEDLETDREDSGIHTSDASCNQSQAGEQGEEITASQHDNLKSHEEKPETTTESSEEITVEDLTLVESTPVSPLVNSDIIPPASAESAVNQSADETLLPADVTTNELFDENCASDLTEQDTSVSVSESSQSAVVFEGKLIIDVKHLGAGHVNSKIDHITKQSTVEEVEFEDDSESVVLVNSDQEIATSITLPLPASSRTIKQVSENDQKSLNEIVLDTKIEKSDIENSSVANVTMTETCTEKLKEDIQKEIGNIYKENAGSVQESKSLHEATVDNQVKNLKISAEISVQNSPLENVSKNLQIPLRIQVDSPQENAKSTFAKKSKSCSPSPKSPLSPKSPTRTIIDFIRNNLLESPSSGDGPTSTFYVDLDSYGSDHKVTQDHAPAASDPETPKSVESATDTVNSEISNLLDEELSKLDQ